ncbi:MAG: YajQ family cyclic di-GMP-binding protein [Myxococcaceae bacterium]
MPSFDVVSEINLQELDNALNQARKEVLNRYDFQGTKTEMTLGEDGKSVHLRSNDEPHLDAAYQVLQIKLAKRGVPLRGVNAGDIDRAALGQLKRTITFQQGIPGERAKELVKALKDSKLKVQGSIQGEQLRVTGKNRDDLQDAIRLLKSQQDAVKLDLQFTNFRD